MVSARLAVGRRRKADSHPAPATRSGRAGWAWASTASASTARRTPRRSATRRPMDASGCTSPTRSGSSTTSRWDAGLYRFRVMRLKLGAQVVALGIVLGLLGLLVWKLVNQDQKQARKNAPAPAFSLPRLDKSGDLFLASLKGKAVVLNFWASWCAPCRDEVPVLQKAWLKHRGQGVVVIGVDQQDLSSDARAFAKKYGMSYPARPRRSRARRGEVRADRGARDVLRRPEREARRPPRRGAGHEAPAGRGHSRGDEVVRLPRRAAGRAGRRRARGARERVASDAARAGGTADVPDLRDSSGHVRCAGGEPHPRVHRHSHQRGRHPERDHGQARGAVRLGDPAAPPKSGWGLLAWLLPLVLLVGGGAVLGVYAWRWSRSREPAPAAAGPEQNGRAPLDPDLERRLEEELARFE